VARRVLVVEDHPTMRAAMRLVLEPEGFEVLEAVDGHDALAIIGRERPEIVFLDLNIPGISGEQLLRSVKEDPELQATRVVVVTAAGEEERRRSLELGADGFLTKPFGPSDLLRTVAPGPGAPGSRGS
jgi:two-component system phosphate regulon response regulator PhoB